MPKWDLVEYIGVAKTTQLPNQEINPSMNPEIAEPIPSSTSLDPDLEAQKHILASFFRTLKHHFGKWKDQFTGVKDPRAAGKISCPLPVLMFTGVLLFVCQLRSRRQINHNFRGNPAIQHKYQALFGVDEVHHGDILNYAYQQIQVDQVQEVVTHLTEILMPQNELAGQRLFGMYHRMATPALAAQVQVPMAPGW